MQIRLSQADDVENIVQLFGDSIHGLARQHYDEAQRAAWAPRSPDLAEWTQRLSTLTTLVAEDAGQLAGFLSFEDDGHVDLLYVAPHAARRGVASALYREAEHRLIALGAKRLYTEASLVAAPFFTRQGFHVVEEQRVERRGLVFRRYAMHKPLAPNPQGG
ncbi:GNAT family N-acetyltransferase [Hydrocarboniphaga effusa]|jgi:putative acetyltransferase|uniref:GCN5-related N-acetyltransferase n=1 Tax=Hydrocarboniphaga effusa AP103 TaxID=1172194 RepID=I7ZAA3_9GAMM|nr:GNAT family N-acetyltransferase [Hydrocarboniphaga effusa]EIT68592.1 GCN5-related N-acetyltransferase [Hydrocarboniphaga effusa AP103]